MRFLRLGLGFTSFATALACSDIDTTRNAPPVGTVGEEVYGAFCDRVASLVFPEDLQGDSYRNVCHKVNGQYADQVDQTLLPPITDGAVDANGNPVSAAAVQQAARNYALARVGAMVRRRDDFIGAVDATLPVVMVPIKDTQNPDVYQSCGAPSSTPDQVSLGAAFADMLGRFGPLYNDGTMPRSTESRAARMQTLQQATDAQVGLHPPRVADWLSARHHDARRDATVDVVRAAAQPRERHALAREPRLDALRPQRTARRVRTTHPRSGPANGQLNQVTATLQQELRTATAAAPVGTLTVTPDAMTGRSILSRPRSNLEALSFVMMAENPAFGAGVSNYIVQRDSRGFAAVPLVNGQVPAPFVDMNMDGLPDVDMLGQFVTSNGMAPPSPFFAVDAPTPAMTYDTFQRSLVGTQLLYGYVDSTHTFTAATLNDLHPLVNPDPTQNHESLMYMLGGAYDLLGSRDMGNASQMVYGDPTSGQVTISYNAFHPESSSLVDLI